MRLADFATDQCSQFGEDGMLAHVFSIVGEGRRHCIEFGAHDGYECSNTAALREQGWTALLIEADAARYAVLLQNVKHGEATLNQLVTPENIDKILAPWPPDLLSMDIDGDEWFILEQMTYRPRVLVVEYNCSIPPHVSLRPARRGSTIGSSALALRDLVKTKGYEVVGMTKGNLICVEAAYAAAFGDIRLEALYDPAWLTYLVTDYAGRPVLVGGQPPWGLRSVPFVGPTVGAPTMLTTRHVEFLRAGFEAVYGPAVFIGPGAYHEVGVEVPDARRRRLLREVVADKPRLVIIDVSSHAPDTQFGWIEADAAVLGYAYALIPAGVIMLHYVRDSK